MKTDGGPAFPPVYLPNGSVPEAESAPSGMSLRDYFAAKALQGMFASGRSGGWGFQEQATQCYQAADAMLAARDKK